jgi:hypothetical protein
MKAQHYRSPYKHLVALAALLSIFNTQLSTVRAQGTVFTYQGRLNDGINPANGNYDLRFVLFDSGGGGSQQGPILTNSATVSNGLFTVTLDFGNQFPGAARWLEIAVRTNGAVSFFTLNPRQPLTPAPYAITAGNVVSGGISSGTYNNAVTFNNAANSFNGSHSGNGGGLTNVNATTLGGLSSSNFWKLGGNTGANPTNGNYLGTSDNLPLEFRVNNDRALRFSYASSAANGNCPNLIGGYSANFASNGVVGGTIVGGGTTNLYHRVFGNFGTVLGGLANLAGGDISIVSGYGSQANGYTSTAMGFLANASGNVAIAMGNQSVASGDYSVAAGLHAIASAFAATAFGQSIASNSYATAAGYQSAAGGYASTAFGYQSLARGDYSVAMGNGSQANGYSAVALGSFSAAANSNSTALGNSFALGHYSLSAGQSVATAIFSTASGKSVATGDNSVALGQSTANGDVSVALGRLNTATGFAATAMGADGAAAGDYSVALGAFCASSNTAAFALGTGAKALHQGSFVWSDQSSGSFSAFSSTAANQFLINATGGVGVGINNPQAQLHVASPDSSPELQITQQNSTDYTRLRMNVGAFQSWEMDVTPGSTPRLEFWNSTRRMYIDFNGNVTATSFNPTSDRNAKENFTPVNSRDVLDKVSALPLTEWNFKEDSATKHIGPMAQDFYAAFGVGPDNKHIATVDADGVALAAIQGLNQKVDELRTELKRKDNENVELKQRLDALERIVRNRK